MRRARLATIIATLALASAARGADATFDRLVAEYAPYVDVVAPLAFGLKVRAISSDPYTFWRGTKGLYYDWCKANAADWLADPLRVPSHGDVHLGNVGTYATDFDRVAFGLVDFDDAIDLPPELDLLDVCITTRLVAKVRRLDVNADTLDRATFDAYLAALRSSRTATELLADDPLVARLASRAANTSYAVTLDRFCVGDGTFRRAVGKGEKTTDLLTPIATDGLAEAIAAACRSDAGLAARMVAADADAIRMKLRSAVARTRLGSSGSQGLSKILVRLDRPFRDVDGDVILYLKEQVPTAAERAGIASRGTSSPGERAARMVDALASPRPIVNASATFAGRSYAVSLIEPWGDELDPAKVDSAEELTHVARLTAAALGAAHGAAGDRAAIAARLTPETLAAIRERADRYVVAQQAWHESFAADPRAVALARRAERAIADATK